MTSGSRPATPPDLAIPLAIAPATLLLSLGVGVGVVVVGLAPLFVARRLRRIDLPGTLRLVE